MSVLVIGVGSPIGDDRVGWDVVAAVNALLRIAPPLCAAVRTLACDRPGPGLVMALEGVQHAVIVDAVLDTAVPPGTVRWLGADGLASAQPASSHGLGVAQALGLARALGLAPERVDLLAIAGVRFDGERMSAEVGAAVSVAAREVLARLSDAYGATPKTSVRETAAPTARRSAVL